ncbi:sensor histidine kinase [Niveibacterium sp.]|uniref:sensor histidine kinase n=1 Tax=Niveibacterium sp. TaxID=2017444 RepID=UPI0035AE2E02
MSRLYLRFYLTLLVCLMLFALAGTLVMHRTGGPVSQASEALARVVQNALPPADAPLAEQQAAVARLVSGLSANVSLLNADGTPIAAIGLPLRLRHGEARDGAAAAWVIRLPDGRWLLASVPIGFGHPAHVLLLALGALALLVALAAYPIVRRITRRLERLEAGVTALGTGNLGARVAVEGRDEVARLAERFNDAAARIEALVDAQRSLLAHASHELRTPLARIRMAVELMKDAAEPRRKAGLERDIAELDALIDEILLSSRLDAIAAPTAPESIDLLALVAEECAQYPDTSLDGQAAVIAGDGRLLRRLIRNLLDNAQKHGQAPTTVTVRVTPSEAVIRVSDAGSGVPPGDRERVFEPFYRPPGAVSTRGSGLGLTLVRKIARHHGGDARCVESGSHTSAFVVTLPTQSAR